MGNFSITNDPYEVADYLKTDEEMQKEMEQRFKRK